MNTHDFTKAQRRELRRLNSLAHERELGAAAGRLQEEFERWRRGGMNVFDLDEHIHRFHDGISRELYKSYVMGHADWNVAWAIAREVLKESEIDSAILELLGRQIAFLKRDKPENGT
jgi:hypothetical protein